MCCGSEDAGEIRLLSCMTDGEMTLAEMNRKITLKNRSMVSGALRTFDSSGKMDFKMDSLFDRLSASSASC